MWIGILIGVSIFLSAALITSIFYLQKFTKIIMIFEDDLDDAIEIFADAEKSMLAISEIPMFFENKETQQATQKILDDIRLARGMVSIIAYKFTALSKKQYTTVWEEGSIKNNVQQQTVVTTTTTTPTLPGQPAGTPNPLALIQGKGMNLDG